MRGQLRNRWGTKNMTEIRGRKEGELKGKLRSGSWQVSVMIKY